MDKVKAVIFDMDGVLIDSEKFWKQAESEVFGSLGVNISDEFTELTRSMTTREVTQFWYERFPWSDLTHQSVEEQVIQRVIELIKTENCEIKGIKTFITSLKKSGHKIGLATNSPAIIIPVVLNKLEIGQYFDAVTSADEVPRGKPHPEIYLLSAEKLQINPSECFVIEDSYSGIIAAKSASMKVAGFTNNKRNNLQQSTEYVIDDFTHRNIYNLFQN